MSSVSIEKTEHVKVGFVMNETAHSKAFDFGFNKYLNLSQDFWLKQTQIECKNKTLAGNKQSSSLQNMSPKGCTL